MKIETPYNIGDKVTLLREGDDHELECEIDVIAIDCTGLGYHIKESSRIFNEDELKLSNGKEKGKV